MSRYIFCILFAAATAAAQIVSNSNYAVTTLIGSGSRGDGGPAVKALLYGASGLAQDSAGNVYISESSGGVIRKVLPDGTIERFAGTGTLLDGQSGSQALQTDLLAPALLLAESDGGLLFSDSSTCRIRRVRTDGIIESVAGSGRCFANSRSGGMSGGTSSTIKDSKALQTDLGYIGGMTFDSAGRLNFTETDRQVVRRLDSDGYLRKVAGTGSIGYSGDDYAATLAALYYPAGLTTDPNGKLYIADGYNCRIRVIGTDGIIDTLVGSLTTSGAATCANSTTSSFSGAATTPLTRVGALTYDAASNSLIIGLPVSYRVVKYSFDSKRVALYLGNGKTGATDTTEPLLLNLNAPSSILSSSNLGVLVSSDTSFQVYRLANGVVQHFAGHWPQNDVYPIPADAQLLSPTGVSAAPDGSVLLTDSGAARVVAWKDTATLTAVAGMAFPSGLANGVDGAVLESGTALGVTLDAPVRVVQRANGEIYIADSSRIRRVDSSGNIKTIRSGISYPGGMTFDSQDRLVYSEGTNHRVMRLDLTNNTITVLAGIAGEYDFDGDGDQATAAYLNTPGDVAYDSKGNLLIADRGNHRIRKVATDGTISTIIGSGLPLSYNDITGQAPLKTGFDIVAMAVDSSDNIYISDGMRVSKVTPDNQISIVTGLVSEDDDGNDTFLDRVMTGTSGISVDSAGRIYLALQQQGQVIVATPIK
jgi:sugar lactone lactonase YvrE